MLGRKRDKETERDKGGERDYLWCGGEKKIRSLKKLIISEQWFIIRLF